MEKKNHILGFGGAMRPERAIPFPKVSLLDAIRYYQMREVERKIGLRPFSLR